MSLIARIDRTDPDPARHIPAHAWSAALWFFAKGEFDKTQIMNGFNMTTIASEGASADETQLDQLIAHYQGLTAQGKEEFHSTLESAGNLLELGYINTSTYMNLLGLS